MTANQVWENWQNKDDTIAFTKGRKDGRKEGRGNLLLFFALPSQCQIFAASGKKPFKVRLAEVWLLRSLLLLHNPPV